MGFSNMLSKLFKKENTDLSVQNPVKFKDFDSIIIPPEPKTRSILIYKTLNLGLEFTPDRERVSAHAPEQSPAKEDEAILLTDDIIGDIPEED